MKSQHPIRLTALCLFVAMLALLMSGCGTTPERAMLASAQAQHLTAKSALAQWNTYLGTERLRMTTMSPTAVERRTAELQASELKVKAALEEYNRAILAARISVGAYFDIKANLTQTNAPPDVGTQVGAYLDAITIAENALINIIVTYAK